MITPLMVVSLDGLPDILGVPRLFWVVFALHLIVIFLLATAVKNDAEVLATKGGVFLVGPWFWFLIVLLTGGYLPTLAYWLIHYSSLRHRRGEGG